MEKQSLKLAEINCDGGTLAKVSTEEELKNIFEAAKKTPGHRYSHGLDFFNRAR